MRIKFIHYLKSLSRLANLSIITMHFPFEQPETQYIIKLTQLNQLAQVASAASSSPTVGFLSNKLHGFSTNRSTKLPALN